MGHDRPELLNPYVVDEKASVKRVLSVSELTNSDVLASLNEEDSHPGRTASEYVGGMPLMLEMLGGELPTIVQLDRPLSADPAGARIRVKSGAAAGRTLYALGGAGSLIIASTTGAEEAQLAFTDVKPEDELSIDNRDFLAYGYYYRHHVVTDEFTADGIPFYPQDGAIEWPSIWGNDPDGDLHGKVILIHHAQDLYVWPPDMVKFARQVRERKGDDCADSFRFWFTDRAEHIFPPMKDEGPVPVHSSRLVNYTPVIEQAMHDVIDWVEKGIAPAEDTGFEFTKDQAVVLAPTGAERRGIQPVVHATANGGARAQVKVGEPVTLEVQAETPPGGGAIVSIEWDMEGRGDWAVQMDGIDGTKSELSSQTTYAFSEPGTYFPSVRVSSRRDGDVNAKRRRIPNIDRVRVVVS
jgi:hypothetical protein